MMLVLVVSKEPSHMKYLKIINTSFAAALTVALIHPAQSQESFDTIVHIGQAVQVRL